MSAVCRIECSRRCFKCKRRTAGANTTEMVCVMLRPGLCSRNHRQKMPRQRWRRRAAQQDNVRETRVANGAVDPPGRLWLKSVAELQKTTGLDLCWDQTCCDWRGDCRCERKRQERQARSKAQTVSDSLTRRQTAWDGRQTAWDWPESISLNQTCDGASLISVSWPSVRALCAGQIPLAASAVAYNSKRYTLVPFLLLHLLTPPRYVLLVLPSASGGASLTCLLLYITIRSVVQGLC